MSDAQSALSTAIRSVLLADAGLLTIIGADGVHDRLLTKAAMPYVVLREIVSTEWGADDDGGLEHQLLIDCWSGQSGHRQAETMAGLIRASLDNRPLALEGFSLIGLYHVRTRTRRETKTDAHVAEMTFRAVTAE